MEARQIISSPHTQIGFDRNSSRRWSRINEWNSYKFENPCKDSFRQNPPDVKARGTPREGLQSTYTEGFPLFSHLSLFGIFYAFRKAFKMISPQGVFRLSHIEADAKGGLRFDINLSPVFVLVSHRHRLPETILFGTWSTTCPLLGYWWTSVETKSRLVHQYWHLFMVWCDCTRWARRQSKSVQE